MMTVSDSPGTGVNDPHVLSGVCPSARILSGVCFMTSNGTLLQYFCLETLMDGGAW